VRRVSGFLAPRDISRIRNVRQVSLAALAQTGREIDGARCRDGSPMRCCPRSVRGCRWDCRNANAGARYGRRVAGRPDHVDVLGVPLDQRCVGDDRHGLDGSERRRVLAPRRSRAVPHRRRGSRCSCTTPGWSSRPSGFRRPPRPTSRRTGAISTCGCRFGSKPAAAQYAWLNTSVFVARGRPQGTGHWALDTGHWALGTSNIRCSGDVVCRTPHPLSSVRKSVGRRFAKRDARCAAGPADRDRA